MSDNKRIAKNTGFLYIRMFLIMGVTLFTSRVVLDKLGADDFGLYNVVGGVVALLGFLNGTLSIGTSRFLTYELGAGNYSKLCRTFVTAFHTHLILAAIVFIAMETAGLWFFYNKLVIPADRLDSAFWVFQISLVTTMVAISQVPYTSIIMAHERMDLYAYVSIYEAVAKLLVVYLLSIATCDRLVFYAALIAVVQISVALFYRWYCHRRFSECKLSRTFDKGIFRKMIGFSGWNIAANISETLKAQGVIVLINMFFQPFVVAAQAIGNQVSGAMMQFVNSVYTAVNPQITKLYAAGDREGSKRLTLKASMYVYDLLLLLGLPLILLMEPIMNLWLVEVPQYAVIFAQYIVASKILSNFTISFYFPMVASGKIQKNAIAAVLFGFSEFLALYIIFRLGGGVMWVQYMNILLIAVFSYVVKPYIIWKDVDYRFSELFHCIFKTIKVTLLACLISIPTYIFIEKDFVGYTVILLVTILSVLFSATLFMDAADRRKGVQFVWSKIAAHR